MRRPPLVCRFAAKQLADGRLLASDLGARGDAGASRDVWRRRVRESVVELLSVLEFVDLRPERFEGGVLVSESAVV